MGQLEWARGLAETLLAEVLPRRWAHTQGVAATARQLAPTLGRDAELIEAAAWLHDIGYAPNLARVGFHPLDGARYLRDVEKADPLLCSLVAHHSGAVYEADERGIHAELVGEFSEAPQSLAQALTYCDITTSPDGDKVGVQDRLTDVLARYEDGHPVNRTIRRAWSFYVDSVNAIEARLNA